MARIKSVIDGRFAVTIVCDTREQAPYEFRGIVADAADGGQEIEIPTKRATLGSGDYSLEGWESVVAVERKSLADLYGTLGGGRERFERELERLKLFQFAAVVVEASWGEALQHPPKHSELKPKTVFRSILAWQQRYPNIHWQFMEHRRLAEVTTFRILERFWKDRQEEKAKLGKETIGMAVVS